MNNEFDLIKLFKENYATIVSILAIFGVVVEATPKIKFNPYSALLRWIGNKINAGLKEDINNVSIKVMNVKKDLDEHRADGDTKEAKRIRGEILTFATSCRNGDQHKPDDFEHIMDIYQDYHDFTEKREMLNGYLDEQYEYILKIFRDCLTNNTFAK